jgi:prophage regulatory protein
VKARTGLSRAGIYQQMAAKKFPSQVSLGGRAVAWVDAEIDAWIESRIAARGGAQ